MSAEKLRRPMTDFARQRQSRDQKERLSKPMSESMTDFDKKLAKIDRRGRSMPDSTFEECVEKAGDDSIKLILDACGGSYARKVFKRGIRKRVEIVLSRINYRLRPLFTDLQATNAKQAEEIGRLRGLLKECEWAQGYSDLPGSAFQEPGHFKSVRKITGACPKCKQPQYLKHLPNCKLKAALSEQPGSKAAADE